MINGRKEVSFGMKKILALAIVSLFIFSTLGAYADQATSQPVVPPMDKTKDRASRAMNNMLYGPVEVPKNLNETNTKGTEVTGCSKKTRTGVERGIARFVAGAWQLATFWYSDPGAVTSTKSGDTGTK
jgi:hypothetical protein